VFEAASFASSTFRPHTLSSVLNESTFSFLFIQLHHHYQPELISGETVAPILAYLVFFSGFFML